MPVLPTALRFSFLLAAALARLPAADSAPGLVSAPLTPPAGPPAATLFEILPSARTGIVAENRYAEPGLLPDGRRDPRVWADRYHVLDVGAIGTGVAIGDYDGDGRPDVFIVSKTESCRLFRNLGDWKFEDVTARAGVGDTGADAATWKQGATFADVDNDGRLDLYVCRFGAPNRLYMNRGDGTFREEAAARGLAVTDASVVGAFCDYDRDGWLDVYVQTNLLDGVAQPNGRRDLLFRNNGDGTFADVTDRAGIRGETQGHSVTWWDHDADGWPDIYVANDFAPPDQLYRNNGDGTFTEMIGARAPHAPLSAMGADFGDVDNDGRIDLLVADMAATSHLKDQRGMATTRDQSAEPGEDGAVPQFLRNTLLLATGTPHFREAAILAGLDATDWTWTVRFEDLDNDGRLDLFVTNGMHREAHNTDMLARVMLAENTQQKVQIEKSSPVLNETNLAYRNLGDLRFEETGRAWGLDDKGVSFGAAFGDLDGDGDLDLVHTNYQREASVLRNTGDRGHRVVFALRGTVSNRFGVGATVRIETAAGPQIRQLGIARGLLSSSEPVLHFGLGEESTLRRVEVTWPGGRRQIFTDLPADRRYTVTEPAEAGSAPAADRLPLQFVETSAAANLAWPSRESRVEELAQQPLLPVRQNRRGPALAVADLNGDRRDDVVMGGTPGDPLRVLLAGPDGRFTPAAAPDVAANVNDGPVLLFDADGDGSNDLLLTRSGTALPAGAPGYQPLLFLNDGHGGWRAAPSALPELALSVGAAAAADFNRDGRLDVFLGARVIPGMYPFAPRSALLVNRGGRFEDATDVLVPALAEAGLVTAALWSDTDGDGWPDLLVATEWGPMRYFRNDRGRGFTEQTGPAGFAAAGTGWWSSLASADFNGDGRPDYAAGNLGLNTPYRATPERPAVLYAGDFTGHGGLQLIEGHHEGDKLYPRRSRRTLGTSIPLILRRFPRNDVFARATLGEILGEDKLAAADRHAATRFESGVFLSQPDGSWRFAPLPRVAQIAPLQGMVAGDFDGDGRTDLYALQNSFAPVAAVGRFDGGLSQLLRGDGRGGFSPVPPADSGLVVPGDAKALAGLDLDGDGWTDFVASRNHGTTLAFRNAGVAGGHALRVRLRGPAGNPSAIGARLTLELSDGSTQTCELQAGSGYFSQTSPAAVFGWADRNPPRLLRVTWPDGRSTTHAVSSDAGTLTLDPSAS